MKIVHNRAVLAATVSAAALALIVVPAGAAQAKSGLSLTARPVSVQVGRTTTLQAQGADDASTYQRICLDELGLHHHWVRLTCGHVVKESGEVTARDVVKIPQLGQHKFRAVLYRTDSHGGHRVQTTSPAYATVHAHR